MLFFDENIPLIFASLAFLVICLISLGIIMHVKRARDRHEMIRKTRSIDSELTGIEKDAPSADLSAGSANAFVSFLSAIGLKTNPGRSMDNADIKLKFLRAGLRGKNVATVFWGTKFFLAILLSLAFLVITVIFFRSLTNLQMLTGACFLAMLGLFLPDMWLSVRASGRKERLFKGFPDALDLLVVCVEAGMGLDAAFNRVGEELALSNPDLSQEMSLLNLELRAGKPRQAALRSLAERTNIDDVSSLVTLLIQTDRFGTSAAQALRVFSDTFRTTRYQRAEEVAAKIATKLIFPLVLCIFPSMFVVVLAPAVIRIYRVIFTS